MKTRRTTEYSWSSRLAGLMAVCLCVLPLVTFAGITATLQTFNGGGADFVDANSAALSSDSLFMVFLSTNSGSTGFDPLNPASPKHGDVLLGVYPLAGAGLPSDPGQITGHLIEIYTNDVAGVLYMAVFDYGYAEYMTSNSIPAGTKYLLTTDATVAVGESKRGGLITDVGGAINSYTSVNGPMVANRMIPSGEETPTGSIRTYVEPQAVQSAGGWRIVGSSAWKATGSSASSLAPGSYDLEFKSIPGWQSPSVTSVVVTAGYVQQVVLSYTLRKVPNDFDGDGISDIGCYYPDAGWWYVFESKRQALWSTNYAGGVDTWPVTGDFDGDGLCDLGTYFPPSGLWQIQQSSDEEWKNNFGFEGTVPVTVDLDGDGALDFGCYYPPNGQWFIYQSTLGFWNTQFGYEGTIPVTGDFDGDGVGDFGCYYAPAGWWYIYKSSTKEVWATQFGYGGTVPVVGDFDGDGTDDFGCYDDVGGMWFIFKSRDGYYTTTFGYENTVPISGDYDGDGTSDFGCYDAAGGNWFVFMSQAQQLWLNQFGYAGTVPLK